MLSPLRSHTYRHLFAAQVVALLGTGLATVALGLIAFDLAGSEAGAVLGTALAIKMIAYVTVAPIAGAFANWLPRRAMLVALDLVRAAVALCLPFVDAVWQVYALIFVLQAASAAFTPTFQATIPDVLPDEAEYTRALSLSQLAYNLETLVSPALAAALLTVISFHWLFAGTALGFLVSAALVLSVLLPSPKPAEPRDIYDRTTRGIRLYLATPRLRGLLALNLAVAAAGAVVIVNTVVLVQAQLGLGQRETAWALAAFGAGSMLAALALPRLLEHVPDRRVMLAGAALLVAGLLAGLAGPGFAALLPLWLVLGIGYSTVQTPTGRLLRRSAHPEDRPALFAAQFALSHACWLLTYPLAGWLGATAGLPATFAALAGIAAAAALAAARLWPAHDPEMLPHVHADLEPGHSHLADAQPVASGFRHAHPFVIDREHASWPRRRMTEPAPDIPRLLTILALCLTGLLVAPEALAHAVAEGDKGYIQEISGIHLIPFAYLGAKHMVTGYDHLLFLAGVVFFLYRAKDIGLYVSLFAIGHSTTTIFGVLYGVSVSAYLIDAVIGFSVVYKALDNLGAFQRWFGVQPNTKAATLVFGLFHGFGLAAKIQEYDVAQDGLVPNLLAFNVGVELGQLLALSAILILMGFWRRTDGFARHAYAANVAMMSAGFVLIGLQLTGYFVAAAPAS